MQVIGITGGVGAGKSAILEYLEQNYRVKNLIADKIARMLMEPGSECYRKLLKFLPVEVYNEDESINRSALSAALFSSDDLRARVNEVMHPAVKEYILGQITEQERMGILDYVIIEAALLIEENYGEICDELWYVRTSEEIRKKRLMRSRGYSEEQVESMFRSQLSDSEYRKHCQVVIENNGTREETFYQVAQAIKEKGELNKMEQQLEGVPLVFGLDIGTRNVVGTVGYKDEDDFYVIAQYMREHETRSMLDGQIHDIGRVGRTIDKVKLALESQIHMPLTEVCIAAAGRVLKTVTTTVEYGFQEEVVVTGEDVHTLDLLGCKILPERGYFFQPGRAQGRSSQRRHYCYLPAGRRCGRALYRGRARRLKSGKPDAGAYCRYQCGNPGNLPYAEYCIGGRRGRHQRYFRDAGRQHYCLRHDSMRRG